MYITMFKDENFRGEQKTIVGPKAVDFYSDSDYNGWNDHLVSMYVYRTAQLQVKCKW